MGSMFAKRLKELRLSHKFTQEELADKLSVSQRTIAFWEKGEREPDLDKLILIASVFGCSLDYLLGLVAQKDEYDIVIGKARNSKVPAKMVSDYIEYLKNRAQS